MAPLPQSSTQRTFVDYLVGGEQHTIMLRGSAPGEDTVVLSGLAEYFAFLDGALYLTTIIGARYSEPGSDVSLPSVWPGSPDYGTGTPPAGQEMKFFSITGRSVLGRRWRVEQFGTNVTIPTAWRFGLGNSAAMDDARAHLASMAASRVITGIDGAQLLLNSYYNFKYADHEIGKARGGS